MNMRLQDLFIDPDSQKLKDFLDNGYEFFDENNRCCTLTAALAYAFEVFDTEEYLKCVKMLIDRGMYSEKTRNPFISLAIYQSAKTRWAGVERFYMTINSDGYENICTDYFYDKRDFVKRLFHMLKDAGFDINVEDKYSLTPAMSFFISRFSYTIFQTLDELGVDFDHKTKGSNGHTVWSIIEKSIGDQKIEIHNEGRREFLDFNQFYSRHKSEKQMQLLSKEVENLGAETIKKRRM